MKIKTIMGKQKIRDLRNRKKIVKILFIAKIECK